MASATVLASQVLDRKASRRFCYTPMLLTLSQSKGAPAPLQCAMAYSAAALVPTAAAASAQAWRSQRATATEFSKIEYLPPSP